jgi:hypothetical protein
MKTQSNNLITNIDAREVSQSELLKVSGGGYFCYKHKGRGNQTRFALKSNGVHFQYWEFGKYRDAGVGDSSVNVTNFASYCLSKGYRHIVGYGR